MRTRTPTPARTLKLAAVVAAAAAVWLAFLPWLARQPAVQERLRWLEVHGIDPSATFYTELPAMQEILRRQRNRAD